MEFRECLACGGNGWFSVPDDSVDTGFAFVICSECFGKGGMFLDYGNGTHPVNYTPYRYE